MLCAKNVELMLGSNIYDNQKVILVKNESFL